MQGWVCIMHGENVNQVALRAGYFAISVQDCGFHQQKKKKKKNNSKKKNDNGSCFHYHAYVLP